MSDEILILATLLFAFIAILYSTVGHAGASGYLAVMGLLSFPPESIKPTSLILNIVVALIASVKFIRAGYFDKKIFFLFIVTSLPMAFIGGNISLPSSLFKVFAGIFLIISAIMILIKQVKNKNEILNSNIPKPMAITLGAMIGFFSGLIGVGGGIFLSPILILKRWTQVKNVSGISALFILCNSIAGLFGHLNSMQGIDYHHFFYWIFAVIVGGMIGSTLGTKKFNNKIILICLFIILMSAGIKFLIS
jgi:uncharacterized membrane protein YfcA